MTSTTTRSIRLEISPQIKAELDRAREFGQQVEEIVTSKRYGDDERSTLLLAYWELVSDFHHGIHALIKSAFFGSAFALVRPVVESLVRAHVAVKGSNSDVQALRRDKYRVNLKTIGGWIDAEFGLGKLMQTLLNERTRDALHGYTHVGLHQLGRRFESGYIKPGYSDNEIIEVIRIATSALYMLTVLVAKHFGLEEDWKRVGQLYDEWGK